MDAKKPRCLKSFRTRTQRANTGGVVSPDNGNIIAESGEGYKNKQDMLDMAEQQFPDDKLDWDLLPSSANPDTVIDDNDENDG